MLAIVAIAAMLLAACGDTARQPPAASATQQGAVAPLPATLPHHVGFGIMSGPDQLAYLNAMRAASGTTWDYRYQYLAGGVNTAKGWGTWESPAGSFATSYVQQSASNGYIPCFVYYMLRQSNGPVGPDEAGTDLAHLADAATMRAYYADWTLLMRVVGAWHKTAVVIVEPDLWGYIERQALWHGNNSAAGVPASVASSGNPDAQRLPNTAQGFAWTLLRIRDRYAPNALLALHASPWGTGVDLLRDPRASIDVDALTRQQAYFLRTAGLAGTPEGISTFDVLSNDIADHDSGQSGIWWDPYNRTLPNFARYLEYAQTLARAAGRWIVLWQVPVGNQYFATEDNSPGHTQDNKAAYILGHVADFARAGIMAVLFGPGNDGTQVYDTRADGITNPAPSRTYACDRCNDHLSAYADDDGGYLRLFVALYYRHGAVALPMSLATASPAADARDAGRHASLVTARRT